MEQWIGGKHAVLEALRSGRTLHKIYVADSSGSSWMAVLAAEAKQAGVPVQRVDKRKLDQLAPGVRHQGVVAQTAAYAYAELDDVLRAAADRGEVPLLVVLDEIEDPHNLGSILRTAECAGVHGVIIPKRRSVGLTAAVAKTSAGAVEHVAPDGLAGGAEGADEADAGDRDATFGHRDSLPPARTLVRQVDGRRRSEAPDATG